MTEKKWVYSFSEVEAAEESVGGDWEEVRALLGGKGAGLADMTRAGVPVPPGFSVTTEACNSYLDAEGRFPIQAILYWCPAVQGQSFLCQV
jgi:pyruvate,orthophosphate dikinase